MIDKTGRGRIIDFGSVASFNPHNRFLIEDGMIRSTPDYFIPYKNAIE
jgi:hypothetical protein